MASDMALKQVEIVAPEGSHGEHVAMPKILWNQAQICLPFPALLRHESSCAPAQKRKPTMKHAPTSHTANVAEPGANVAPHKASSNKPATVHKSAPQARKPATGAKPKKNATPAKAPSKTHAAPRKETKSAKIFDLLGRANGATLAELMKATGWQAHSVRGFLSTASRKRGAAIQSLKKDKGERVYRLKK
jgi:hypothetical protein